VESAGGVPVTAGGVPLTGRSAHGVPGAMAECLQVRCASGVPAAVGGYLPRAECREVPGARYLVSLRGKCTTWPGLLKLALSSSKPLEALEGGVPRSGVCGRSALQLRAECLPGPECAGCGVRPSGAECLQVGSAGGVRSLAKPLRVRAPGEHAVFPGHTCSPPSHQATHQGKAKETTPSRAPPPPRSGRTGARPTTPRWLPFERRGFQLRLIVTFRQIVELGRSPAGLVGLSVWRSPLR
jgi:hypothetical protein